MIMFHAIVQFGMPVFAVVFLLSAQVSPPARPNLSGTWKLNLGRSGPILPRGTEALTVVFEHHDPVIKYSETRCVFGKTTHDDSKAAMIDGRWHIEHPTPGETRRSMQKWDGTTLVLRWELTDAKSVTYSSHIRTTLSTNGNVLTMAEHYVEPGMERIRDWVFDRQ